MDITSLIRDLGIGPLALGIGVIALIVFALMGKGGKGGSGSSGGNSSGGGTTPPPAQPPAN